MMPSSITRSVFLFNIFISFFLPASAQHNRTVLTKELERAVAKDSLPGIAFVLVDSKHVTYNYTFGHADIAADKAFTLQTTQEVGSVSKMILAVALMKAVELGYFTLDTEINTILPFPIRNPYEPGHAITFRELATHTSGIIDNPGVYLNTYQFHLKLRPYSPESLHLLKTLGYKQEVANCSLSQFYFDYLAAGGHYFSSGNFVFTAGSRTSVYSNVATALIAYLIEVKAGISYDAFTKRYIFKPLNMRNSRWFTSDLKMSKLAQLYFNDQVNFPLYDLITYPEGGLKTNAHDLSRFLIDMIKGLAGKSVILKAESFQAMFKPQFFNEHPPARINLTTRNKGILWNLYTNGTIGHDGDDPGVSAFIALNPSTGLGGLFLCNKYMDDNSRLVDILTKAISQNPR